MNRSSLLGSVIRALVLVLFAVFIIAPLLWLVLAPTKTDYQLATGWPFAFGSVDNVTPRDPPDKNVCIGLPERIRGLLRSVRHRTPCPCQRACAVSDRLRV